MAYWSAMGSCFAAGDFAQKRSEPKSSELNALAEDEHDGYLRNGGDSDPAETTVGKPAIS